MSLSRWLLWTLGLAVPSVGSRNVPFPKTLRRGLGRLREPHILWVVGNGDGEEAACAQEL